MAINQARILYHLENVIHPQIVRTVLYDRHVENRMDLLVHYERLFEEDYGVELFIQCDVEDRVVSYDIESFNIMLEMPWKVGGGDGGEGVGRKDGEEGEGEEGEEEESRIE